MIESLRHSNAPLPLLDQYGRVHSNLRLSVTDRCNIRCVYCMPAGPVEFRPREELLTFEEITRFVRAVVPLGINKIRVTGGEPLLRSDLPVLIEYLSNTPGITDLALTTNGMLLSDMAQQLKDAGLKRLNISLDALTEETFQRISRRPGVNKVLDGIFAAQAVGFEKLRLNSIALQGITEDEAVSLAEFSREHDLELRFIEFMPLDADDQWSSENVLTGASLRKLLEDSICALVPLRRDDPSQPAVNFRFIDGKGKIGFINSVSEPFCEHCNRLRLTAEGQVRNCLFSNEEWDARHLLRSGAHDEEIRTLVRASVTAKQPAHGIGAEDFEKPPRAMYQIGG